jgi:hypothetical protein
VGQLKLQKSPKALKWNMKPASASQHMMTTAQHSTAQHMMENLEQTMQSPCHSSLHSKTAEINPAGHTLPFAELQAGCTLLDVLDYWIYWIYWMYWMYITGCTGCALLDVLDLHHWMCWMYITGCAGCALPDVLGVHYLMYWVYIT